MVPVGAYPADAGLTAGHGSVQPLFTSTTGDVYTSSGTDLGSTLHRIVVAACLRSAYPYPQTVVGIVFRRTGGGVLPVGRDRRRRRSDMTVEWGERR